MKFNSFAVLGSTALLLSSCATLEKARVKSIAGPDGSANLLITCYDVENCYEKATQMCGKYKILNTSTDTSSSTDINKNVRTYTTTKLLVKCAKKSNKSEDPLDL